MMLTRFRAAMAIVLTVLGVATAVLAAGCGTAQTRQHPGWSPYDKSPTGYTIYTKCDHKVRIYMVDDSIATVPNDATCP